MDGGHTVNFEYVDLAHWARQEHYYHYLSHVPCTYSMTTKLDVTPILQAGHKIYPVMLYCLAKTVNRYTEFRMDHDADGRLGYYKEMYPCYTIFHKDTETFSNLWTEYIDDYTLFEQRYRQDLERYGNVKSMQAKPDPPANTFPVSMVPWENFDGFNLNLEKGYQYLLPIFTMGKYVVVEGRYEMPLSIQVHHAVCDGFHVCRFLSDLRSVIREFYKG